MHEEYCRQNPGKQPGWNALGRFLRRSNLATADHLDVKVRILTGASASGEADYGEAAERWKKLSKEEKDRCRRIEHERWMRFQLLNNWQYGPVRDNEARIHPLIRPFDDLSPEEQAKDDYGWKLLENASEGIPDKS